MKSSRILVGCLVLFVAAAAASAEKVDTSPQGLRDEATHVVVGKVKAIYTREADEGKYRVTRYVAEVAVESLEKGEGPKAGELVYVRYWRQEWRGSSATTPIGTSGHRGMPAEGATVRLYLAKNAYDGFTYDNKDGGFNVLGANGFEAVAPAGK